MIAGVFLVVAPTLSLHAIMFKALWTSSCIHDNKLWFWCRIMENESLPNSWTSNKMYIIKVIVLFTIYFYDFGIFVILGLELKPYWVVEINIWWKKSLKPKMKWRKIKYSLVHLLHLDFLILPSSVASKTLTCFLQNINFCWLKLLEIVEFMFLGTFLIISWFFCHYAKEIEIE
jgi:hypothetical protein